MIDISKYVLVYPTLLKRDCQFSPGDFQYNNFMHIFHDVLNNTMVGLLL